MFNFFTLFAAKSGQLALPRREVVDFQESSAGWHVLCSVQRIIRFGKGRSASLETQVRDVVYLGMEFFCGCNMKHSPTKPMVRPARPLPHGAPIGMATAAFATPRKRATVDSRWPLAR